MELIYFCPETMGFYINELTGDAVGKDFIELTHEEYLALAGQALMIGLDGRPTLYVPPQPSNDELSKEAKSKRDNLLKEAALRISPLQDAVDLGVQTEEEQALLVEWKTYRIQLSRLEKQENYPLNISWPDVPKG